MNALIPQGPRQVPARMTIDGTHATNGRFVPTGILPHTYGYDEGGLLVTDTVVYEGVTYRQTFTYDTGRLVSESAWEVVP